jgi:AraC family transcriptional activator of pobA
MKHCTYPSLKKNDWRDFKNIEKEYNHSIDQFSQDVMVSQIELLLNYSNRFYNRQFITRKTASSDLLTKMEILLDEYFKSDKMLESGLPTVQFFADKLNLSPNYLSDMLRIIHRTKHSTTYP